MDILKKWSAVVITADKKELTFDEWKVNIDWLVIDFPWEYEKSSIMCHTIEKDGKLLFQIRFDGKIIGYINYDELEITEDIVDFFWNIDILVLKWSKSSIKIFENMEAKVVVPFWEWKDIFFSTLWQHPEVSSSFRIKSDLDENEVIFVNLD